MMDMNTASIRSSKQFQLSQEALAELGLDDETQREEMRLQPIEFTTDDNDRYRCLSNGHMGTDRLPQIINIGGLVWPSLEHWLTACRFLGQSQQDDKHAQLVACILKATSPQLARAIARYATTKQQPRCRPSPIPVIVEQLRGHVFVRPDWEWVRVHLLTVGLQAKFDKTVNPKLVQRLKATNPRSLVAIAREDTDWYVSWEQLCFCEPSVLGSTAVQHELVSLGDWLMQLRDRLRDSVFRHGDDKYSPWTASISDTPPWRERILKIMDDVPSPSARAGIKRNQITTEEPVRKLKRLSRMSDRTTASFMPTTTTTGRAVTPVATHVDTGSRRITVTIHQPPALNAGVVNPRLKLSLVRLALVTSAAELMRVMPRSQYTQAQADVHVTAPPVAGVLDQPRDWLDEMCQADFGGKKFGRVGVVVGFPHRSEFWARMHGRGRVWVCLGNWSISAAGDDRNGEQVEEEEEEDN